MIEEMAKGQKYVPDFGYSSPRRTRAVCNNPAFMDHKLHRVGWFKVRYDTDGLPGWLVEKRCVNCGLAFDSALYLGPKEMGE
jgi:hypothetical protein